MNYLYVEVVKLTHAIPCAAMANIINIVSTYFFVVQKKASQLVIDFNDR